jgi:Protein of unknown function (DUF3833)
VKIGDNLLVAGVRIPFSEYTRTPAMPFSRRHFTGISLGALTLPFLARPAAAAMPLLLEEFFVGHTRGQGSFISEIAGIRRDLTVDAHGSFDGRTLILTENIAYDDGQRETAIWRFDKTGPAKYDGQRTGVLTVVPVRIEDGRVRMSYVSEVTSPEGNKRKLRFDDALERTDARTVVNRAKVSLLGFPVGNVEITFKKL